MEWVKASKRLPELNKEISFRINERRYAGKMIEQGVFQHNGYACTYGVGSVEWLDESSSPVPEDVKEAAYNYSCEKAGILDPRPELCPSVETWHFIHDAFLAGHAYKGQQGELRLTDDVKTRIKEKSDTWNDEIKPHFARGMVAGYNMAIHDAKRLSPQPIPIPENFDAVKTINVPSCPKHGGTSSFDNCELCKLEKMEASIHAFPSVNELCKQLEDAHDWKDHDNNLEQGEAKSGYGRAVDKVRELLSGKIITTPQAISDVWDAAQHYGEDFNAKYQFDLNAEIDKPDKATYLKEHFNIEI